VRYVSGLQRRLESRSWQKAEGLSAPARPRGFPVDGRCYKVLPFSPLHLLILLLYRASRKRVYMGVHATSSLLQARRPRTNPAAV
jgi:hypothetical protein